MKSLETLVTERFTEWLTENKPDWFKGVIRIAASSTITLEFRRFQDIYDINGNQLNDSDWLISHSTFFGDLFKELNQTKLINRIIINLEGSKVVSAEILWDQSIQDEFEDLLPKSKKGKLKAWYLS